MPKELEKIKRAWVSKRILMEAGALVAVGVCENGREGFEKTPARGG